MFSRRGCGTETPPVGAGSCGVVTSEADNRLTPPLQISTSDSSAQLREMSFSGRTAIIACVSASGGLTIAKNRKASDERHQGFLAGKWLLRGERGVLPCRSEGVRT